MAPSPHQVRNIMKPRAMNVRAGGVIMASVAVPAAMAHARSIVIGDRAREVPDRVVRVSGAMIAPAEIVRDSVAVMSADRAPCRMTVRPCPRA